MTEARWTTGEGTPLFAKVQELRQKVERLRAEAIKDAEGKIHGLVELAKIHAQTKATPETSNG